MRIIAQIDAEISYIVVVCNSYFVPYFTKKERKYNIIFIYVHLLFFLSVFLPTEQQLGFLSLDISCLGVSRTWFIISDRILFFPGKMLLQVKLIVVSKSSTHEICLPK